MMKKKKIFFEKVEWVVITVLFALLVAGMGTVLFFVVRLASGFQASRPSVPSVAVSNVSSLENVNVDTVEASLPESSSDVESISYYNSAFGFSLTLPPSWKGYQTREVTKDRGEKWNSGAVGFYFLEGNPVFTLTIHSYEQWKALGSSADIPSPQYLGKDGQHVFGTVVSQPGNDEQMNERLKELEAIFSSFRVFDSSSDVSVTDENVAEASNPLYSLYENTAGDGFPAFTVEYPKGWYHQEEGNDKEKHAVFRVYPFSTGEVDVSSEIYVDAYASVGALPGAVGAEAFFDYLKKRSYGGEVRPVRVGQQESFEITVRDTIVWREVYAEIDGRVYVFRINSHHEEMNKFDHLLETFAIKK